MVGGEVLIQGLHRVNEGLLVHVFGDDGALGLHGGQQLVVLHAQGLGPLGGGLLGGGGHAAAAGCTVEAPWPEAKAAILGAIAKTVPDYQG